ncbi:MAG: hypothetical protein K0Q74_1246, partial [Gammaproteobacteria bacterium]|nr:hypothetical protein [Gammaproteobacteria bacterium]
ANENSCGHYVIDYMVSILINPDKTIGDFFARHRGIVLSGSVFFPTAGLIFGALTLFMGLDVGLSLELCFYIAVGLVGSTPTVGILRSLWTILTDTGPSTPTPELQPPSVVSPCLRELSQHSVGQGNQQEEVNVAAYHEAESAAYNLAVSVRPQPQPNNGAEEQHGQQSSHTPRIWQSYGLEPNDGPDYAGYDRTGPSPQPVSEVRMGV